MKFTHTFLTLSLSILNLSIAYTQSIEIPDSNFERALIDLDIDSDNSLNGVIDINDINNISILDVSDYQIDSLNGIEWFESLEHLNIDRNNLQSLNLNFNTNLSILFCRFNPLNKLDLSLNQNLTILGTGVDSIQLLDLSNNELLKQLFIVSPYKLDSLNLSKNRNLEDLVIQDSYRLKKVDLTSCVALKNLKIENRFSSLDTIDVSYNTRLERLHINGFILDTLILKENTNLKSLDCSNNLLNALDLQYNIELEELRITNHPSNYEYLSSIDTIILNNPKLKQLNLRETDTRVLDLANSILIKELALNNIPLSKLDLRNAVMLEILIAFQTNQDTFDLSNNRNLKFISLSNDNRTDSITTSFPNKYKSICLKDLPLLETVYLQNNSELVQLNIQNGSHNNITLSTIGSKNLTEIIVDDENQVPTNWEIDSQVSYSDIPTNCNFVTSTSKIIIESFRIYPNPSSDNLYIQNIKEREIQYIELIDNSGRIYRFSNVESLKHTYKIIQPGLYHINIKTINKLYNQTILKI